MENQGIIYKIKSYYIIKNIFNCIKDRNLQLKLFIHSNYFQTKLNIKLVYKQKYLNKIGFNLDSYLYIEQEQYKRDILNKKYNNFLLENKINKKKFEDILFEILENNKINDTDEGNANTIRKNDEILINIDSPLSEIISKTKIFESNFTIYISQKNIDEYKLKDDYLIFFNKLNQSNIKYSSIYYIFNNKCKINKLKELNIDFNKVKRITLIQDIKDVIIKKNKVFFETLFSIKGIENNLVYLKIYFNNTYKLKPKLFENINNFKSLKYLEIKSFNFDEIFTIRLSNLISLSFKNSKNIIISDTICQQLEILNFEKNESPIIISNFENTNFKILKELNLAYNDLSDLKILEKVKLEQLKRLNLEMNVISNINFLEHVNFKELKELNLSNNEISDIDVLEKVKFEKLEILNLGSNEISNDINILENVNFKELKELNLFHNNISDIKILEKIKFEKLEILNLGGNEISNDINILENVNFKELRELNLFHNNISDIKVFEKVKFYKLEKINLGWNEIDENKFSSIINNLKLQFKVL